MSKEDCRLCGGTGADPNPLNDPGPCPECSIEHKGSPEEWAEWNEDHDPKGVFEMICDLHCTVCDGADHHWMTDCDPDGEPVMVCKHCPAVRDWDPTEDEENEWEDA